MRRGDLYRSFAELTASQPANGFVITDKRRGSATAIVAPHGGLIEPGTSQIARAIAGDDLSLYLFEGRRRRGNRDLHIGSERFDEPKCLALISTAERVVTVHGAGGMKHLTYVGGRDQELGNIIIERLRQLGIATRRPERISLLGVSQQNICNRGRRRAGVQLELTLGLRRQFFSGGLGRAATPRFGFYEFVRVVRNAILE